MIVVNEILKTIKEEMESNINSGSDEYNTDPTIGKGWVFWNKAPDYPFLGFYLEEVTQESFMGDEVLGKITITFYGHAEATDDEYNNEELLIELMTDLQYFVINECTYRNMMIQSAPFITAGNEHNNKTILSFQVSYELEYEATVTTVNE